MKNAKKEKPKVALVLSSGGARGMAQIGVIEELERLGFEISSIAGTSIGSLIGGMYATGNLRYFKEWIVDLDKLDVFRLIDFSLSSSGFIKGEKVYKEMETFIKDKQIESLPIPYAAVAADVITGEEIVLREGSLFEAIKASSAIPTVLQPRNYRGRELVDGGVVNPIPVKHVTRSPGDLLIVVNLNAKIDYHPPVKKSPQQQKNDLIHNIGLESFKSRWIKLFPGTSSKEKEAQRKFGYLELMSRSFDLVQDELCQHIVQASKPDVLVEISRNACSTFEFYRADELISEGKRALNKALAWKMLHDPLFKV